MSIVNNRRNTITLIPTIKVLELTTMSTNIVETNLVPVLRLCQDKYIKKILGKSLYDSLFDDYKRVNLIPTDMDDGSISGVNYKELYDYVEPALAWWVYAEFIIANNIKTTEQGSQSNYNDWSNNSGMEATKILELRIRNSAEFYMEELNSYVEDTFKDDDAYIGESVDEGRYFDGIFFPNTPQNCNKKYRNGFF